MANFIGALIRRERLRQNYSQEGLCRGICAVSYLSKIEQGKVAAGEDILLPLLDRLGIVYERDGDFLRQIGHTVEALYEELLSGQERLPAFAEHMAWLEEHRDRCLTSPYMLDVMLLATYVHRRLPDQELAEFVPCMDRRQYALYLALQLDERVENTGDELLRLSPCGFYTCMVGINRFRNGRYLEAVDLLSRSYDLAAREGNVHLMYLSKLMLGNCYSIGGQRELMLEHYRVARKLAAALGNNEDSISIIDYNLGSTYLEWGMIDEAYALLRTVRRQDTLYYHKLAIVLEKLGRREEALEALALGQAAVDESQNDAPIIKEMLDLVEYRLKHPDYLRDGIYSSLMTDTFRLLRRTMPSGFAQFHLPYMLEVLEAERRYKEAYRLSIEFSGEMTLLSI